MRGRSFYVAALLAAFTFMVAPRGAHAQATPTPTASATPANCTITTLPQANPSANPIPADCATGWERPPSFLGVSGGNYNSITIDPKTGAVGCYTGTMGAVVQDTDGNQYVLGTSHGLARNGGVGVRTNEPILQPGLPDLGCWQDPTDTVAQLSKWGAINFKGGVNQLDAAIAKVVMTDVTPAGPDVPGVDTMGRILNLGDPTQQIAGQISTTPLPFDSLEDGLEVMKMGRGSCLTVGVIESFDAMGLVIYPSADNSAGAGIAYFDHQTLVIGQTLTDNPTICSFATNTDSGALVLTYNANSFQCLQAIGMIFAGSSGNPADSGGDIVAINPLQAPSPNPLGVVGVLDKFKVSLVGDSVCVPPPPTIFGIQRGTASDMTDALRASIERVRKVKELKGHRLLRDNHEISAIGIAKGDVPDTAVLNVYLEQDTPAVRARVLSQLRGVGVRFKNAAKFHAL